MTPSRRRISQGSTFEDSIGYSRAVAVGPWTFVAGTTGYDYATMTISPDVAAQTGRALGNIAAALAEVDATLDDVVRVRYLLTRRDDWPACWPVLREAFGTARPAATMIICGLQEPEMLIEIEVTAYSERDPAQ
ncbi:RidA family protein [Nostocoides sp. F2B08]|uniref:RidA family protein n=1 Tax=Nostocoides sp. F2B08 TaxID=2653936 RepID=UPI0012636993|nr:RidA family protein [Tetrasphaera sp. F2B08]KAB7746276.1 RidA family protein [Tetrasphaera sp. F2B08]